jgi:hypothetical protein
MRAVSRKRRRGHRRRRPKSPSVGRRATAGPGDGRQKIVAGPTLLSDQSRGRGPARGSTRHHRGREADDGASGVLPSEGARARRPDRHQKALAFRFAVGVARMGPTPTCKRQCHGVFGHVAFFGQPAKCEVAHTSFRLAPLKSGMATSIWRQEGTPWHRNQNQLGSHMSSGWFLR